MQKIAHSSHDFNPPANSKGIVNQIISIQGSLPDSFHLEV